MMTTSQAWIHVSRLTTDQLRHHENTKAKEMDMKHANTVAAIQIDPPLSYQDDPAHQHLGGKSV